MVLPSVITPPSPNTVKILSYNPARFQNTVQRRPAPRFVLKQPPQIIVPATLQIEHAIR